MKHEDFRRRLDEFIDAQGSTAERFEMEQHARECRDCAGELAALRALVQAARSLPSRLDPPAPLWSRIDAALDAARSPVPPPRRGPSLVGRALRGLGGLWSPSRTGPGVGTGWRGVAGLAGAAAALVALLWGSWELIRREAPTSLPSTPRLESRSPLPLGLAGLEQQCMGAGKLLQAALRTSGDPATGDMAASLAPGLEDVDRSIAETRAALVADPEDGALLRMLALRYQQKLELLHEMLLRVEAA
jgi:hypothetical protein